MSLEHLCLEEGSNRSARGRHMIRFVMLALGLAVAAGAAVLGLSEAAAQDGTIEVTTSEDGALADADVSCPAAGGDECTLRAAVTYAASDPDVDTIVFGTGVNPQLSDGAGLGQIQIAGELTIRGNLDGDGGPGTTISGGEPGVDDYDGRLIDTEAGTDLTLENLVLTGGKLEFANARGGAIQSLGALTVLNSRVHDNRVDGNLARGGAIFSQGPLTVRDSEFVENRALGASGGGNPSAAGGAIAAHDNETVIERTTFLGNEASRLGGAVAVIGEFAAASVEVRAATFGGTAPDDGNTAGTGGAFSIGIDSGSASGLISRSTFVGNEASNVGGAIYVDRSELEVSDTGVSGNEAGRGGGLYSFNFEPSSSADVTVRRSTFSGNQASVDGGALYLLGSDVEIVNSTISGNTAALFGGGIYVIDDDSFGEPLGATRITHTTIVGNSASATVAPPGAGLHVELDGITTVEHSIVAGNVGADCVAAASATLSSDGYNLDSDGTCAIDATDQTVDDVMLGDLADNGGPTLTHLPLEGSPAIDGGLNPTCVVDGDQRGEPRPGTNSSACDIGAVEVQLPGEEPPSEEEPSEEEADDADDEAEELPQTGPAEPVVSDPDFTG